jgi:hypothetical protein
MPYSEEKMKAIRKIIAPEYLISRLKTALAARNPSIKYSAACNNLSLNRVATGGNGREKEDNTNMRTQ